MEIKSEKQQRQDFEKLDRNVRSIIILSAITLLILILAGYI